MLPTRFGAGGFRESQAVYNDPEEYARLRRLALRLAGHSSAEPIPVDKRGPHAAPAA
jgi:hypothetical protein